MSFFCSSSCASFRTSRNRQRILSSSCRYVSSFQPSDDSPPFTGQAIFPDIVLTRRPQSIVRNEDPDAVFVVTGASRGIGCQLVQSLLDRTQGRIVACCRSPNDTTTQLHQFLSQDKRNNRVTVCRLDLEDQFTIDQLKLDIQTISNGRVDVLWNVAGLLGDGGVTTSGPERSVAKLDRLFLERSFAVNTIGPMMLCQALLPMMKQRVNTASTANDPPRLIVNLSARVGSISDNNLGGWFSYRCSKSALNQFTRTLSHETTNRSNVWAVSLHPGTTNTDLSTPFQKNVKPSKLFPVEFTANRLLDIIDCLEKKHSGGFYDWAGKSLPY